MKNTDDAIDAVLEGLRDAEAPTGMNFRILAAAERRASALPLETRVGPRFIAIRELFSSRKSLSATMGLALAALILAAIALAIHAPHPARTLQSSLQSKVTDRGLKVIPTATVPQPSLRNANVIGASPRANHKPRHCINHPAPEAPLTEQEKLLLQIAQAGNPHEITMLNSAIRSQQDAEEEAEFKQYVDQSTTGNLQ